MCEHGARAPAWVSPGGERESLSTRFLRRSKGLVNQTKGKGQIEDRVKGGESKFSNIISETPFKNDEPQPRISTECIFESV